MDKIDTFEKFGAALEEADYDFEAIDPESFDSESLKNIILTNTQILKNAHKVLIDYYGMKVPTDFLQEVLIKNIDLAYEAYTNGIRDTCQRDILIDAILRNMGMNPWPTYAQGEEYMQEFKKLLPIKAKEFGILITLPE